MRQRLFFISLVLIIFSIASGLGLRYALAVVWTEPTALPPGDNVPAPINVGAGAQIKTGDLTIGGNFSVSSGEVVGAPAGGNMGVGTLNAEQLCIQGNCRLNWPEAVNAFVDEGNVGFGPTAVLGTNDNVPLSLETNGVGRMMIGAAGNVGIGTTNTAFNLMVGGVAPRIYLLPGAGSNPELDFGSPAIDTHWAIYRDTATDQLRFWRTDNRMVITSAGNVGLGTISPNYKLHVIGAGSAPDFVGVQSEVTSTADDAVGMRGMANSTGMIKNYGGVFIAAGSATQSAGVLSVASGNGQVYGVYGQATGNGTIKNYGGYFEAYGTGGDSAAVFGRQWGTTGNTYGGDFYSSSNAGVGIRGRAPGVGVVYGVRGEAASAAAVGNVGGYFISYGTAGSKGVWAVANGASGINYGVYGQVVSGTGWAGYFTGGQGLYTSSGVVGAPAGGSKGAGAINVELLCIQGNCLGAWPAGVAPGGGDGQIQFNDGGAFTGDAGLTFDKVAGVLTVGGNLKVGMGAAGNDDYIYFDDGSKYIKWEDAMGRFYSNGGIFSAGQVSGSSVNAYSGGSIQTTDASNTKAIVLRHDGMAGFLYTDSSIPGVNAGNLTLRADAEYPANYVEIADELRVNSILTVVGNATVLGKNVCLQDGTNCPGAAAAVQLQAATPGVAQVGHLNISGTGIFGGLQIGALNGVLKAAGGVVSGAATTSDLPEGANLYFTNARARAAISVGDGPLGYNPTTGVIGFSSPLSFLYGGTGTGVLGPAGAVVYNTGGPYAFTAVGVAGQFLKSQGAGAPIWADVPSGVGGSGTTNYVAKFTGASTVGNSTIYDNGTNVQISGMLGLGWSPIYKLDVNGSSYLGGAVTITGDIVANSNTPSGCVWTTYAASVICPNGQFVAGIRYSASTVSAYCCEL